MPVGFLPTNGNRNTEPSVVAQVCDPSTWDVKAGRTGNESQPQLHSKSEVSLDYTKHCRKEKKQKKKRNRRNGKGVEEGADML